jgi:hypothetical protein
VSQGLQDGPDQQVPRDQRLLSQDLRDRQVRLERLVQLDRGQLVKRVRQAQVVRVRLDQRVAVLQGLRDQQDQLGQQVRQESLEPQVRQVPLDPSDQLDSREQQDLRVQLLASALLARPDRLLQDLQVRPDLLEQLLLWAQQVQLARQAKQVPQDK